MDHLELELLKNRNNVHTLLNIVNSSLSSYGNNLMNADNFTKMQMYDQNRVFEKQEK